MLAAHLGAQPGSVFIALAIHNYYNRTRPAKEDWSRTVNPSHHEKRK